MGQIKNIKLHIVTDIKVSYIIHFNIIILPMSIPGLRRFQDRFVNPHQFKFLCAMCICSCAVTQYFRYKLRRGELKDLKEGVGLSDIKEDVIKLKNYLVERYIPSGETTAENTATRTSTSITATAGAAVAATDTSATSTNTSSTTSSGES